MSKYTENKAICKKFNDGVSVSDLSRQFDLSHATIIARLKKHYQEFYHKPYVGKHASREAYFEDLYKRYKQSYQKAVYTREKMCEILNCSTRDLLYLERKYKLNNQWLQTYHNQKTLCNVSNVLYDLVREYVDKYKFKSNRDLAMTAIIFFLQLLDEMEQV